MYWREKRNAKWIVIHLERTYKLQEAYLCIYKYEYFNRKYSQYLTISEKGVGEVYLRRRSSPELNGLCNWPSSAPLTSRWSLIKTHWALQKNANRLVSGPFSFSLWNVSHGGNLTVFLICKSCKRRDCCSNPLAWGLRIIWSRLWSINGRWLWPLNGCLNCAALLTLVLTHHITPTGPQIGPRFLFRATFGQLPLITLPPSTSIADIPSRGFWTKTRTCFSRISSVSCTTGANITMLLTIQ